MCLSIMIYIIFNIKAWGMHYFNFTLATKESEYLNQSPNFSIPFYPTLLVVSVL